MLDTIKITNVLFLDVETAPLVYKYKDLPEKMKPLWDSKFRYQQTETPESLYTKAGIYAEFANIICISVGYFHAGTLRF